MVKVAAVILAGGRGKRMGMLCDIRPKPILPFAGRFRVIDFCLSNCVHSQIGTVGVLTDYQRSQVASYLTQWNTANAGKTNFQILEPRIGSYKGTSDAVYQNFDYLRSCQPEAVLVLAGDHIYKMDYREMLAFHEEMGADVTVGVISVPIGQAHRFGIVNTDALGRITNFTEKPRGPTSNLASMGIYIFNPNVLTEYLIEDSTQSASIHDFGYIIIPRMVKHNKVFAYRFDGYWRDIGTVDAYYEANMELIHAQPSFSLDGTWPIFSRDHLPPPQTSYQDNAMNSIISPGCDIKGRVENSILSQGVTVEEQAMVKDSIILANAVIGKHSVVDHSILDEGVKVDKFCYVGFGGLIPRGLDITVLGRGVAVPPGTAIGRHCRILSGAKPATSTGTFWPYEAYEVDPL